MALFDLCGSVTVMVGKWTVTMTTPSSCFKTRRHARGVALTNFSTLQNLLIDEVLDKGHSEYTWAHKVFRNLFTKITEQMS